MDKIVSFILILFFFFSFDQVYAQGVSVGPVNHGLCKCFAQEAVDGDPIDIEIAFSFPPLVPCVPETLIPKCQVLCRTESYWNRAFFELLSPERTLRTKSIYLERVEGYCLSDLNRKEQVRRIFERDVIEEIPIGKGPALLDLDLPFLGIGKEFCLQRSTVSEKVRDAAGPGLLLGLGAILLKYIDLIGARAMPIFMMPSPMLPPEILQSGEGTGGIQHPRAELLSPQEPRCIGNAEEALCMGESVEIEIWSIASQICYLIEDRT